jgi:hypothetical protein
MQRLLEQDMAARLGQALKLFFEFLSSNNLIAWLEPSQVMDELSRSVSLSVVRCDLGLEVPDWN